MKRIKEKNIEMFNKDVNETGKYQYTNFEKYSAYIATKRQTEELIKFLKLLKIKSPTILDVGCGDGTFTFEISKAIPFKKMVGFDFAKSAVKVANNAVKPKDKGKMQFLVCDIYDSHKKFKKNSFDFVVIRGVLHHLYDPQKAIKSVSSLSNNIIVLEPSGYNPILKVIEKVSPYHRAHEEKSFYPPKLNSWFEQNGYRVKKQTFFSIVPYFCPTIIAKGLKSIEPLMERVPYIKVLYCGTNLIFYERK